MTIFDTMALYKISNVSPQVKSSCLTEMGDSCTLEVFSNGGVKYANVLLNSIGDISIKLNNQLARIESPGPTNEIYLISNGLKMDVELSSVSINGLLFLCENDDYKNTNCCVNSNCDTNGFNLSYDGRTFTISKDGNSMSTILYEVNSSSFDNYIENNIDSIVIDIIVSAI